MCNHISFRLCRHVCLYTPLCANRLCILFILYIFLAIVVIATVLTTATVTFMVTVMVAATTTHRHARQRNGRQHTEMTKTHIWVQTVSKPRVTPWCRVRAVQQQSSSYYAALQNTLWSHPQNGWSHMAARQKQVKGICFARNGAAACHASSYYYYYYDYYYHHHYYYYY